MTHDNFKTFVHAPPPHARRLVFQYRQAIGIRQQVEKNLQIARVAIAKAQADGARAQAEYNKAIGVEQGYQEAVVAIMDPDGADPDGADTDTADSTIDTQE